MLILYFPPNLNLIDDPEDYSEQIVEKKEGSKKVPRISIGLVDPNMGSLRNDPESPSETKMDRREEAENGQVSLSKPMNDKGEIAKSDKKSSSKPTNDKWEEEYNYPEFLSGAMSPIDFFKAGSISAQKDRCPNPLSNALHPDGKHGLVNCHFGTVIFLRTKGKFSSTSDRATYVAYK